MRYSSVTSIEQCREERMNIERKFGLSPLSKHILYCITLLIILTLHVLLRIKEKDLFGLIKPQLNESSDPFIVYGRFPTVLLYFLRFLNLFSLPMYFLDFLGHLIYNPFDENVELKRSSSEAPLLCFRIVTRGSFPNLVRETARKNLEICLTSQLSNFIIEIVTNEAIDGLLQHPKLRQIVVPPNYETGSGALFKVSSNHPN